MQTMPRQVIKGHCECCGEDREEFAVVSSVKTDAGPWICSHCAVVVENFLNFTGFVIVRPVFPVGEIRR